MQDVVHILTIKRIAEAKGFWESRHRLLQRNVNTEQVGPHSQRAVSGQRGVRIGGRGQTGPEGRITSLPRHFLTGTYGNATQFLSEVIQILPSDCID